MNSFDSFELPEALRTSLNKINFTEPTPIQEKTLPLALAGKDLVATAQTGTGKTAAFTIPMVTRLMKSSRSRALILTPTRELAIQIEKTIQELTQTRPIKAALLIGGEPIFKQLKKLDRDPRIIIGTPGRVNDHLERGSLMLHTVDYFVLDEADRMLEMGFLEQIEKIAKFLTGNKQTLMFSATMPKHLNRIIDRFLVNPSYVKVGSTQTVEAKITQKNITVDVKEKYDRLLEELEERSGSVIVFLKTKRSAEKISDRLYKAGIEAQYLHGDLPQRKRERVIEGFRNKRFRVLIATDVAARGLDVPHIEHVINYDVPHCKEDYIHRVGRTGRAGAEGFALNFMCNESRSRWRRILQDPKSEGQSSFRGRSGESGSGAGNRKRTKSRGKKPFRKRYSSQSQQSAA